MRAPTVLTRWLSTQTIFVVLLFTGIFTLSVRAITDPDVWWHLKTGQLVFECHAIPHTDPFSFTRHGQPWTTHEWLAELLMYGVYRISGWGGLILLFSLLTTAGFVFLYLRCAGRPYVAGLILLWGAFASRPTWGVRPQTISVLLASVVLWLLERSERNPRRLWWIVPLIMLWANLHAGYILGIVLMAVFLIGGWLDRWLGFDSGNRAVGQTLARVFRLSLVVVAVNPNGLRLYAYPFETFASQAMQSQIAEWFSPNFHRGEYGPFLLMLLGTFVVASLAPSVFWPRQILLLCAGLFAALHSVRYIPIFVLVAVPPVATGVRKHLGDRAAPSADRSPVPSVGRVVFHLAILALVGALAWSQAALVIRGQPAAERREFPSAAASFMLEHRPGGPIFNYYNWGGYLIWRLSPEYPVFIDGRADLYGDMFLKEFSDAYTLTGDWKTPLEQWGIRTVVIPLNCPLAVGLQASLGWKLLYRDEQALVLTKEAGEGLRAGMPEDHPGLPPTFFLLEYATN
jgi:hypothetical protein